ncbi:COX15/CtaA family protein [Roseateles oligotrophus]|uniref:COX15/CtaA family protein n=1 Tax=Roseateles oligotrophus TaxID=1769250 RepID=A0ABT2Y9R9_9BURK|nr:COX15/CtaA family protein [Roseateles oligotrophus]MCV2367047.1 COX15/CtaA family protein [Roseateles oligotrophus]
MNSVDHRLKALRRLALLCMIMVLAVTGLSAYIRLSKVGLGCTDWPQCYGQSLRQAQQGQAPTTQEQTSTAMARLAHRATAVTALLLVIMMVMSCYGAGAGPALRQHGPTALALLGLTLFLAVLGVWSSGARVPAVTIGNLLGGFGLLALCGRLSAAGLLESAGGFRYCLIPALLLLLLQVVLGGLVSASYAGMSCSGWGECLASAGAIDWAALNPWREPLLAQLQPQGPAVNPNGALAQSLHRLLALGLALLLPALAIQAWRLGRPRRACLLLLLLLAQTALGFAMLQGSLPLSLAMLHNLLAAGLLSALLLLF